MSIILVFVSVHLQPVNEEPAAKEAVTRGGDASIPCGLCLSHTWLHTEITRLPGNCFSHQEVHVRVSVLLNVPFVSQGPLSLC